MKFELLRCSGCGLSVNGHYWMCDEQDGQWCPPCFDLTTCGKNGHSEGCPTQVWNDNQPTDKQGGAG